MSVNPTNFHVHLDQKVLPANSLLNTSPTFCENLFALVRGGRYNNRGGKHGRSRENDSGAGRPNKAQKVGA